MPETMWEAEVVVLTASRQRYVVKARNEAEARRKLESGETESEQELRVEGVEHREVVSEVSEVVHLLKTRGGSACGAQGPMDADINRVTCDECSQLHADGIGQ